MFDTRRAFSGFSVDDIDTAELFYRDTLGVDTTRNEMGILTLHLGSGGTVIAYPKRDHEPAAFTILNFGVSDIDEAVDRLIATGIDTMIFADLMPVDEKGVMRGNGPDIAWFRDPAGNILSVIADGRDDVNEAQA